MTILERTDLQVLPPLYGIEDYANCTRIDSNYYCNVQAKLNIPVENENVNNIIREFSENLMTLDRTIIHRTLCVPLDKMQDDSIKLEYMNNLINKRLRKYNLTAEIDESICAEVKPAISVYSQLFVIITFLYLSLVLYATYRDWKIRSQDKKIHNQHRNKTFLSTLSLYYTWKKRTTIPGNVDYQKLLSIQGIRFFSMVILVIYHVFLIYPYSYISDPTQFERITTSGLFSISILPGLLIVLTFFLFSSWLLTVQVYNIVEERGELSLRSVGILIINRYARLMVTYAVCLAVMLSPWITRLAPCSLSMTVLNEQACSKNWLRSLLLISNFDYIFDICHAVSWYISADFQLFLINLFVLYLKFKSKIGDIKFYSSILILSMVIHGAVMYSYTDVIYKVTIRALEERHLRHSIYFVTEYISTTSIWPASFIGVILGHIYYKTKNISIKKTWFSTILWASVFLLLPSTAIYISQTNLRGLKVIILACFMKPLYTLGMGLGVYGMSHNLGGVVKNLLESKYVVMLSNFSYCVYLVHPVALILIDSSGLPPLEIKEFNLIIYCLIRIIPSFILGAFIALTVEEPGAIVQKKYLPQISKWKKEAQT